MLKRTVPVLGFPAAVLVPVRLPTEVAELLILGRKQNCPLLLSRLILPELPSLAEHGRLPGLCQRSCSFSSAPSGGFPSEPEFIPLFKSDIQTCFVAGLSEVFYRTCRPRRSLRGGILIKKRNMCLGKKGEALWIQSLTEPTFGLAVWPEPHGRHKHTFHWWGPSLLVSSETNFHARWDSRPLCRLTVLKKHHQNIQTCPVRSEMAEELNHRASVPSVSIQSQHRNMWSGFQKNSTAWGLCWTSVCKHNSGNCRMQLWKSGPGWDCSKNWPWASLKMLWNVLCYENVRHNPRRKRERPIAQKKQRCCKYR